MKKAARFTVQGTVQGVFFRQFIKEEAEKLGLKGFTRNTTEGTVEVLVEGEKEAIGTLGQLLMKGPAHAQIRNVESEEKKWTGEYKEFKILKF
jgi:acylphosphatase